MYEIKLDINESNRFGYNGSQNNLKDISYTLLDGNFVNLKSCLNNPFFITEELKDLANYNFKSIEEQTLKEANKQSRMSGISAFLAFLTFLASILVPVLIATCKGKL